MWLTLVSSCGGGAALLYALYRWVIPAVAQHHAGLALLWHEFVCFSLQRLLGAVQKNATRGDPGSVIQAIDHYCRNKEWAMNVGDEKGCILDSVVSEVNPATVLELGTYCGYSTVRIARLLPPHAKLITLEFNPAVAAIARQVIAWAGLEDKVQLVEGASGDFIPRIKEQFGVKTFDLVFLDHWKEYYLPDTKLMEASVLCSFHIHRTLFFLFPDHDTRWMLFAFSPPRSVASSGKAASCWQTTSSAPELRTTWNMSGAARDTRAATSSPTWSTPKWRTAWRSLCS
uniref:catechol O-methyltransferase n=1 Tax=Cyclopterus lumpus TaxID=8103 RepID=A0A8C2ZCP3_CYCLU